MRIGVEVVVDEELLAAIPQIAETVEQAGLDVLWWHPVGSEWTSSWVVGGAGRGAAPDYKVGDAGARGRGGPHGRAHATPGTPHQRGG
ncbi:hypothetical protein ACWDT6_15720, partial [Nocardia grenadensis]